MHRLALLVLLPLAACGDGGATDDTSGSPGAHQAIEQTVQSHFEGTFNVRVASVSCDDVQETPSVEIGAVTAVQPCVVEQTEGVAFQAEVRTANATLPDGETTQRVTVAAPGTLLVSAVEDAVSASISQQVDTPVATQCDVPRAMLSTPGDTFRCTISNGTEQRSAVVTITSQSGDIDFVVAN